MKFNFKLKPDNPTSKIVKMATGLSICIGVIFLMSNKVDNETAVLVSGTLSGVATFFIV